MSVPGATVSAEVLDQPGLNGTTVAPEIAGRPGSARAPVTRESLDPQDATTDT